MRSIGRMIAVATVVGAGMVATGGGLSMATPASAGDTTSPERGGRLRLPGRAGPHAPSHVRLVDGDDRDGDLLADVRVCADCHPEVVRQWRSSAHAHASFGNPYYRAVVDAFRRERGRERSRFCAGCHEPALLLSGAMSGPIRPSDPRAHAGVTCLVCHGIREVRPDGNGSYTLTTAPVPYPDPADPAQIRAHRQRLAADVLRTGALCGACHRSFLGPEMGNPHHLPGIDDLGSWRRSAWSGNRAGQLDVPLPRRDCRGCHMPAAESRGADMAGADGVIPSHRFAGAHTAMAAELGDPEQERAAASMLKEAVTLDVAAVRHRDGRWSFPAEAAEPAPGETVELLVVVRNVGAGHRFPGGTRDLQHTWLEVRVRDRQGRVVGRSDGSTANDPAAAPFDLRAVPVDRAGSPVEAHFVHAFRAVAADTTIPPRDARAVRYVLRIPPAARGPFEVTARVRHTRHAPPMRRLACEASRSRRGRAFAAAARRLGRRPIDGCASQPVTELASVRIRTGSAPTGRRPVWSRLYDLGLALSHGPQERVGEARHALERALALLGEPTTRRRERAMTMALLASVAGRQGRRREAIAWLDRARETAGPHPALARIRAEAHGRVWKWSAAERAAERAASGAPGDDRVWALLAQAAGSAGDDGSSLRAASRGLGLQPRHPALLRSQAVSIAELLPRPSARAWDAFLAHRPPPDAPELRRRCDRAHPTCARDRRPIPTVRLAPSP